MVNLNKIELTFKVERLVEYFDRHQSLDRAYGWGMQWRTGSK